MRWLLPQGDARSGPRKPGGRPRCASPSGSSQKVRHMLFRIRFCVSVTVSRFLDCLLPLRCPPTHTPPSDLQDTFRAWRHFIGMGSCHRRGGLRRRRGPLHPPFFPVPCSCGVGSGDGKGCTSFLDSLGDSFGCARGPSQRGLGGCGCLDPLLCLHSALLAGNQRAGFLGGRGSLRQGGGLGGCLLPLPGSDRGAAVPSRAPPGQLGEVGEDGLCLHPQKVLGQGCLLPALHVSAHLLLQLLEETCEGPRR